ncbi:hypothetical protein [Methylomicrobium sp. Wu6]|uniref:hypothetical protein n=1 Tax=Methylomicrobium sp. Wu6 TaxID=3107928 RepID=UPI002DD6AB77|nr:hypothetical protein [Methylomicrobium sp. Wu6]MEC4747015.1 hypothetical protein [Methylomicrobium sp. Wu6]
MPDEWTFSRAFAEFSTSRLPERVHEALIQKSYAPELVGHISRDSTAIEAREKPVKKAALDKVKAKRGRPKVMCHLMFGILALTANQLVTFVT